MEVIYKVKTNKTFEKAVEDLKTSLNDHNFGVLWELNFKDKLKEKGLEFDTNFKIFEVCNPEQAKIVLEKNIEVGFFLPCKMIVYDYENSVFIGMLNPIGLIGMIDNKDLSSIATEVERELKDAIDSAI